MKNRFPGCFPKTFIPAVILLITAGAFLGCASQAAGTAGPQQEKKGRIYLFEVNSPQEAVYNGKPHAIAYKYTGDAAPDIVYFSSSEDMAIGKGGSRSAPVNAGNYYVRLTRPVSDKNYDVREFYAVLSIKKRPVKIEAEKPQTMVYDGNPKRIRAASDPMVPLAFSYYPNLELLETAKKAAEEASSRQDSISQTFKGYRRIDRAPSEPGIYYVWIYYPGDENTESASMDVVLSIEPPKSSPGG